VGLGQQYYLEEDLKLKRSKKNIECGWNF